MLCAGTKRLNASCRGHPLFLFAFALHTLGMQGKGMGREDVGAGDGRARSAKPIGRGRSQSEQSQVVRLFIIEASVGPTVPVTGGLSYTRAPRKVREPTASGFGRHYQTRALNPKLLHAATGPVFRLRGFGQPTPALNPQALRIQGPWVYHPGHQTFRLGGGKPSVPNPFVRVG